MLGRWIKRLLAGGRQRDAEIAGLLAEATDLLGRKERAAAQATVERALGLDGGSVAALQLQGAILCELGRVDAGLASFRAALRRDRTNASLRFDCGNALCMAGDRAGAEIEYRLAIQAAPDYLPAHKALAGLLMDAKRSAEAITVLEQVMGRAPEDVDTQRRLAMAAYHVFDYAKACALYEPLYERGVLDLNERYALGAAALNLPGRLESARTILEDAIARTDETSPLRRLATLSLANCHLLSGDWCEGFRLYEGRHDAIRAFDPKPVNNIARLDFLASSLAAIPAWDGGDCRGKRLLIWAEQGLGDAIMLMRFLSVLRNDRGAAAVSFLCEPALMAFAPCCPDVDFFLPGGDWKAQRGDYDAHCSLVSLPHLLGVTPENIPGRIPYFQLPDERRIVWRQRTDGLAGLRVGLAWAGNPNNHIDVLRSVAFDQLRPLLAIAGTSFVSLQKDAAAMTELSAAASPVTNWMTEVHDFVDTAALIDSLDLVISVDTAVAHLAGALGKPVWLLNRYESEWRWMRDREETPWYPSMRIFNQTQSRNWGPVIEHMANELRALAIRRASANEAKK